MEDGKRLAKKEGNGSWRFQRLVKPNIRLELAGSCGCLKLILPPF
jgi:hypothetical protein